MTPEDGFLLDIREHPEDDTPRLVFADWLEDNAESDRANFIRALIARHREPMDGRRWLQSAAALLEANWSRWVKPLSRLVRSESGTCHEYWLSPHSVVPSIKAVAHFPRGFVRALHVDLLPFVTHAEDILRVAPITELRLGAPRTRIARLADCPQMEWIRWLEFYDYYRDPLDAAAMTALAKSPHLKRLTALILARNNLSDRGVEALAHASWLRGVERLDLTDNAISAPGIAAVAESPYMTSLRLLILDRNLIDNRALASLAHSVCIRNLTHLSLLGTDVTQSGAELLREANPQLSVVYSGGSVSPRSAGQ